MSDNSLKTSQLPYTTNIATTDRILVLYNANNINSIPSTRTIDVGTFAANLVFLQSTPANSSANGLAGTITYDPNYVYVCISNNSWRRAALSVF